MHHVYGCTDRTRKGDYFFKFTLTISRLSRTTFASILLNDKPRGYIAPVWQNG
jgi:hypothetical protein